MTTDLNIRDKYMYKDYLMPFDYTITNFSCFFGSTILPILSEFSQENRRKTSAINFTASNIQAIIC